MKILISADIHIDDYPDYNYSYRSRLKQFNLLADRLIEIGNQYNCREHWILGDIINRPNSRKYIENVARNFLKKQLNNFDKVRFIFGQHDLSAKAQDIDFDDTLPGLFEYENLIYMDHQLLEMDGHLFGFMNWRPEQDLTWLGEKHLDVLFAHYTKSDLFGQEIDESKFDLMIHGDIHNSQVIGKYISVCNPIQKDMSSEKEGKCIIFDTETLKWERVLTDPDHTRFLQIDYTSEHSEEGFKGNLQYNIYVPDIIVDTDGKEIKKTITWNDIDELIDKTAWSKGVRDIHQTVESQCIPYSEVDFNFQLLELKIHGYRSIVDQEFKFTTGDKVALLGDNGSGKSSVIGALQNVFNKNRYLGYEKSDFTDTVSVTVKILYQNKVFELTKGSELRFVIDGVEQTYNNMTELESDVFVKLPFLNYLDLFFINSNVNNLSSKFDSNRRIELISKFYRLDRINAYYQTAVELKEPYEEELRNLRKELDKLCGVRDHLIRRISELKQYEDKDSELILAEIKNLEDIKLKHRDYKAWVKSKTDLMEAIQKQSEKCDKLKEENSFNIETGEADLRDLNIKLDKINEAYESTFKQSELFTSQMKEFKEVESKGLALMKFLEELKKGVCPECGNSLSLGKAKEMYEEKSKEKDELNNRWVELDDLLDSHPKKKESKPYYIQLLQDLKASYKDTKDNIELLSNRIKSAQQSESKLKAETLVLTTKQSELDKLLNNEPENPQIPTEIDDKISNYHSELSSISELKHNKSELGIELKKIEDLENVIKDTTDIIDKYNMYIEMTSTSGVIYEEILTQLAKKFSTNDIRYDVESGIYRGNRYINFNSYFKVRKNFRLYESCSDGQRIISDLDFLSRLFSVNVGLLILDEYLKMLDDKYFPKACEILSNMNVNTIILSTHDPNLTIYTKRIYLELDENGVTQVKQ